MAIAADRLNVLAVEPFYGGSHRCFLENAKQHSRHRWQCVTGKPVHWKWRMRSAPLSLAADTAKLLATGFKPDVVLCTDMLDLPQWRGMLRDPNLATTPVAIYFHENQWTYPIAPQARIDHHFGYTNLMSALAADAVIFNSQFHRETFLSASSEFLARMPDGANLHDLGRLRRIAEVIPPGFSAPSVPVLALRPATESLTIGWVARWENDKRPDRFEQLLDELSAREVPFRLILLGPRPRTTPDSLRSIRSKNRHRIVHDGFADSRQEYWQQLHDMDVVVSTADHEFFGIAICEAIWAGAIPILPNRLSYPELAPAECLYSELAEAVSLIESMQAPERRSTIRSMSQAKIEAFQADRTIAQLDEALSRIKLNS